MSDEPQATHGIGRRQLQQIMAYLSEGVILLNPGGDILWANRAALDTHGCATLQDIGGSAAQYAERFLLRESGRHALEPGRTPLARLISGESFAWLALELVQRKVQQIARMLEFRGLVLSDDNDRPELMVLFIIDTTEKVDSDELFDRFFSTKPSPAAILRLDDSRYIRVNAGFCEMTGFDSEDIIGRPFHEIDVLHDVQRRDQALRALATHAAIGPLEARVHTRDGDKKSVMLAGQPIVVSGRPCMLFTFIDLEAQRRAEQSLRQSEERFAKAFRMAPVPMAVCVQSNWCVIEANGAFATAVGRPRSEIVGRSITSCGLHLDRRALRDITLALEAGQRIRNRDVQLRAPDNEVIDGLLSAESVTLQDEACALFVIQDITERKRSETEIVNAMEAVMKDASWFSRTVMEKLAQVRRPQAAQGEVETLTARETEVLELICSGHGDAVIAERLGLSRNTVRNHVATLYGKIGVNRRSTAVIWGRERGFGATAE